jgi:hypothetical protein
MQIHQGCRWLVRPIRSAGVELGQLPHGVAVGGAEVGSVVQHPQQVVEQHHLAVDGDRLVFAAAGVDERGDQWVAEVLGADHVPPPRAAHEHHHRRAAAALDGRQLRHVVDVVVGRLRRQRGVAAGGHGAEVAVGRAARPPCPYARRQALALAQHHVLEPVHLHATQCLSS